MKKTVTELVFILDKSGSMSGLEKDTIGGFNSMLKKQKRGEGKCFLTTALFDNNYELLHDRINIKAVKPITDMDYYVGGSTALYDAIGNTIKKIISVQNHTAETYRADKVMFVIITDGEENASHTYKASDIKKMIASQKECGWEFIFLGANIDAVTTAQEFGIDEEYAAEYVADKEGTALNFEVLSDVASRVCTGHSLDSQCLQAIREDYNARDGRRR